MAAGEKRRIRRDLLRYCRTDTGALARLHRALGRQPAPHVDPVTLLFQAEPRGGLGR